MNKVVLVGRLTGNPELSYSKGENAVAVGKYIIAVDRRFKSKKEDEQTADFIPCIVFGGSAEFAEKYFTKGMRIALAGRIQTSNFTNDDGKKVFYTNVVVEEHEFAQGKSENESNHSSDQPAPVVVEDSAQGFMNVPDGIDELPF